MKDSILEKLSSRKFWIALAAFLASIGASIAGLSTGNETLAWVGVICSTVSAAIYAAAEAFVDAAAAQQTIYVIEPEEVEKLGGTE